MTDTSRNLPPPEQQAIRARCFHPGGPFGEFPKADIEGSVPERFEKMVRCYPNRTAVKSGAQLLTYEELNRAANRIARAILSKRGVGSEPIALLYDHGPDVIGAILGVLKAGKFYVPLDVSLPPARLARLLKAAEAAMLVSDKKNSILAAQLSGPLQLEVMTGDGDDFNDWSESIGVAIPPHAFAAVIFTSGSTGDPKGVIHTHRNFLEKVMVGTNDFHISVEDRFSLVHSFSSNASVRQLFGGLLVGASVFPIDVKTAGLQVLGQWLGGEQVTVFYSFPTLFRGLAAELTADADLSHLRLLFLGGELVTEKDIRLFKARFSESTICVNLLGSNETGSVRCFLIDHGTRLAGGLVPAGYPVSDRDVLLLDESGGQVGWDQVGEIAVRSRYLSPGYWRNEELTLSHFSDDPENGRRIYRTGDVGRMESDGCLYYLGRKASTAKIRGYLVSLVEVENCLAALPEIKDSAVIIHGAEEDEKHLIAYVVARQDPPPRQSALRQLLRSQLPSYMIPSQFVFLEKLPLTPNGKVDRLALANLRSFGRSNLTEPFVGPRTQTEEAVAAIWAAVLEVDRVGIFDNFFDLGGNSLAAGRVVSQVIKKCRLELPVRSLFQASTVAQMAALIAARQERAANGVDLDGVLREVEAMTEEEARKCLALEGAAKPTAGST